MNTQTSNVNQFESTYAMLVRSEQEERSIYETLVYGLMIFSAVVSIWQLALQPVVVPTSLVSNAPVAQTLTTAQPAV